MLIRLFLLIIVVAVQVTGVKCYLTGRGRLHSSQMARASQKPRFDARKRIFTQLDMASARDKEVNVQDPLNNDDLKRTGALKRSTPPRVACGGGVPRRGVCVGRAVGRPRQRGGGFFRPPRARRLFFYTGVWGRKTQHERGTDVSEAAVSEAAVSDAAVSC